MNYFSDIDVDWVVVVKMSISYVWCETNLGLSSFKMDNNFVMKFFGTYNL